MKTFLSRKLNYPRVFLVFFSVCCALFTAVVARPAYAAGTTYYVNCSASSNGNGSQSSPWNTLTSVNSTTFNPGDSLLFQRGTTCSGELHPLGSGNSSASITIDASGTGALPIINGGSNAAALELSDQQYWEISDLEIVGGNPRGVYITGIAANTTLQHFRLTNLLVHDVGGTTTTRNDTGLVVFSPQSATEAFSDVVVNGVTAYNTQESEGIIVEAGWNPSGTQPLNSNVTVENSTAHDTYGDGIVIYETQNGLLQSNVEYHSGKCPSGCGSTPVGLWEWWCHTCTVQGNESYANTSWGADGGDFDIDYHNQNNTVQYNYGHDSAGYCVSVFGAGSDVDINSVIRYNVCANNDQATADAYEGEIFTYTWDNGTLNGVQIYNNTFYHNPVSDSPVLVDEATYSGSNTNFFKNNLIYSTTTSMVNTGSSTSLDNNLYWTTNSNTPTWTYKGSSYTGFSSYQSGSGQDAHGKYTNPLLNTPTYHGVGMPMSAFTLQSGSPALGAGTLIGSNGGQDFYGNIVSSTAAPNIGAYNGTSYTSPTNLVSNGGFESGLNNWSSWGGTNTIVGAAHTGSSALQVTGTGGVGQNISGYTAGQTYTLSGWGEVSVAGQTGWIGIHVFTGGSSYVDYSIPFNTTSYTYGSLQVTLPTNTSAIQAYVWNGSSSSSLTADDLTLTSPANLVSNGGFESGLNNWSNWGGTTTTVSSAHSGSSALQDGTGTGGVGQDISGYSVGHTYTLSGWGEVSTTGQTGWIGIHVTSGGVTNNYALPFNMAFYTYGQLQITLPSNTTDVQVYVWNGSNSSSITADDIMFY